MRPSLTHILLCCLLLPLSVLTGQVNFKIDRYSDTHFRITGTGTLPATAPTVRPYLCSFENLLVGPVSGSLTFSDNTLEIGGVPVVTYLTNTDGRLSFHSTGTPFPAGGAVSGSVEINLVGATLMPDGTTGDFLWGLDDTPAWLVDAGDYLLCSQAFFKIERFSDTELRITGSGNMPATAPTVRPWLCSFENILVSPVTGTLAFSNNTLEIGGVPVVTYLTNTDGRISLNSTGTAFPAGGAISGSVDITLLGATLMPASSIGDFLWGQDNTPAWLIDAGNYLLCDASTLPVQFTFFHATIIDQEVELNWGTHTEYQNEGFDIQRSTNGQDWLTIGFVEGRGTVATPQRYSFADVQLSTGNYYYRLRQKDVDGGVHYSIVRRVSIPAQQLGIRIFPNPSRANINFQGIEEGLIIIYDRHGKMVLKARFSGSQFDISMLPKGAYLVYLKAKNGAWTHKQLHKL